MRPPITGRKGEQRIDTDDIPPTCDIGKIAALKPAFRKEGGTVTPANSSSIADGAAALVLMRESVVTMAPMRDLDLPHAKVNVNGGACALGHPIGASGARQQVTLVHALRHRGRRRGIASLCLGGGEATAVAIEMA